MAEATSAADPPAWVGLHRRFSMAPNELDEGFKGYDDADIIIR
jgi:hypothetical protein